MKIILYTTLDVNFIKNIIDNVEKYQVNEVGDIKENLKFIENYKGFTICFNEDKKYYMAIKQNEESIKKQKSSASKNSNNNNIPFIIITLISIILAILTISQGSKTGNSFTNSPENVAVEYVKSSMKNPDSFELVKKSAKSVDDGSIVYITYRGTNSFNAVVTEEKKVYLNENNNVIGIE